MTPRTKVCESASRFIERLRVLSVVLITYEVIWSSIDGYASFLLSQTFLTRCVQLLTPNSERRHVNEGIDERASISSDSIVGESCKVGERAMIKKSAIGRHCVLGKNVRIVGSVIGDHCVVADG